MAAVAGLVGGCNAFIGIVTLNLIGHRTAVGVVVNIAVIIRLAAGILAVQVHIGFAETAAHQSGKDLTACVAPQCEGVDQLAAGLALLNCIVEGAAGFADPAAAAVICKGYQCIKLALGQGQVVFINKLFIDGIFGLGQAVAQQNLRCLLGNAVLHIFFQHIIGATGAITDGILTVIPIGFGRKTFFLFQNLHQFITDLHFRGSENSGCSGQHQARKQHNCQQKTGNTFHHR